MGNANRRTKNQRLLYTDKVPFFQDFILRPSCSYTNAEVQVLGKRLQQGHLCLPDTRVRTGHDSEP